MILVREIMSGDSGLAYFVGNMQFMNQTQASRHLCVHMISDRRYCIQFGSSLHVKSVNRSGEEMRFRRDLSEGTKKARSALKNNFVHIRQILSSSSSTNTRSR